MAVPHHTRYRTLWPRVRAAKGKRVRLRVLANPEAAWNTASRLRCTGIVPNTIALETEGAVLYGRLKRKSKASEAAA